MALPVEAKESLGGIEDIIESLVDYYDRHGELTVKQMYMFQKLRASVVKWVKSYAELHPFRVGVSPKLIKLLAEHRKKVVRKIVAYGTVRAFVCPPALLSCAVCGNPALVTGSRYKYVITTDHDFVPVCGDACAEAVPPPEPLPDPFPKPIPTRRSDAFTKP